MSLPVFLFDAPLPEVGAQVELSGPEARHAVTVKRLRVGEKLVLIDGRGGRAEVAISAVVGKDRLVGGVEKRETVAVPTPRAVVVQALPKSERSELAVDLATQAGVDAIVPWQAARCVSKWVGAKRDKGAAKWRSAALAAAKQARRAWVPEITDLHDTPQVVELIRRVIADGGVALVLHEEAARPFAAVDFSVHPQVLFIIGPEGGFDPAEITEFNAAGAQSVLLGPEILRTASAAMVALAALGVRTGRW